jgi:uncharacterized protein (DUF433 family)
MNMVSAHRNVVVSDPDILGGTPVFAGTRVPVDTLLAHLKAGDTIDTFLEDFPSVSRAQVAEFLDCAAALMLENGRDADSP